MGFWEVVYSTGDLVKGITPDLSTVKWAGGSIYSCTTAAVSKIDQVVRVDGIQKLPQYWPDGETRAQIGLFTTTLAKNTARYAVYEGFKHIPGATVASKLVSDTMREVRRENHKGGMKAMQAKVDRLEKELRKSTLKPENLTLSSEIAGGDGAEKTKDMINVFMKEEFVGNHMFNDLWVPKIARMKTKDE